MKSSKKDRKYYSYENILSKNAIYNMVIGERSNGKSYGALKMGIDNYVLKGEQMAIVRRYGDDFKGARGAAMFSALVEDGYIEKVTKGKWTSVYYYSSRWYLCKFDEDLNKRVTDIKPFCWGFSISAVEHDKSTSYPEITTIVFDEFIARGAYLSDEFVLFMNVLSTIIRDRVNVKIFMLGNTVSKYCPYFDEMGLKHIKNMKPNTIDVYTYGESGLSVAVELCGAEDRHGANNKPSDIYFAFDNPKLNMITSGIWEVNVYPHHPKILDPDFKFDIEFIFFIQFDRDILQCEIQTTDRGDSYIYIHKKTTPIKDVYNDIIYTPDVKPTYNYRRNIYKPLYDFERIILKIFKDDKIFYQDNDVGEIVRNYLLWCRQN